MKRVVMVALVLGMAGSGALAKPALRDVPAIDDGLMAVAIADQIRKSCDGINARMIRALTTLNGLKTLARSKGYSDDEIEDYVTSKAEKRRMKSKAEAWLGARGVTLADESALCAFGRAQIRENSAIGRLLK